MVGALRTEKRLWKRISESRVFSIAFRGFLAVILLAITTSAAQAAIYSGVYVFGDSLSDVGNKTLSSYYWNNRYSNGPVWCEQLSGLLGTPALSASSVGGTDYATGGATVGDVALQVSSYLGSVGAADSSGLYAVWVGANNFFQTLGSSPTTVRLGVCSASLTSWVHTIVDSVKALADAGATDFLIMNLPALGSIPYYESSAYQTEINDLVEEFNRLLADELSQLAAKNSNLDITLLDTYALFLKDFSSMDDSWFWDAVHPTTEGHALVTEAAYDALTQSTAVPEPGSMVLWAFGATIGLASVVRRRELRCR